MLLFWRIDIEKEKFDLSDPAAWYNIKLLVRGADNTKSLSYQAVFDVSRKALEDCFVNVTGSLITSFRRGCW
jgi:hypothetical protein